MQTFDVWYMRPSFFQNGIVGYKWLERKNMLPDPTNLDKTHIFLKQIEVATKEVAFRKMQGECWSPNGEARSLIMGKGLRHTSMSVGDILVDSFSGAVWMVDVFEFTGIGITKHTPSPKLVVNNT